MMRDRVGLLDAGDTRVEQVRCARHRRIDARHRRADVGHARAHRGHQRLERIHILDGGQIAGNGADLLAHARGLERGRHRSEGFIPRSRQKLAVLAHIRSVEPLRFEPVPDVAGLVGNPLLVHSVIHARQDAEDLSVAAVDPDIGADRIHHVDALGLHQLPWPRHEGVGL